MDAEHGHVITFRKAAKHDLETLLSWIAEPHVTQFWDNSQEHKDDIVCFTQGRQTPSSYAGGRYVYWIASWADETYALLMAIQETHKDDIGPEKTQQLSKTGHTYSLEYMIGNPSFFNKGYGAKTLLQFLDYFRKTVDHKADTFLIDPDCTNVRAKHVYTKAGFLHMGDFMMEGDVSSKGKMHHLFVRKFAPHVSIVAATIDDYPRVQNMARFYVYDFSRECGSISVDWAIPEDGLYECFDLKKYFTQPQCRAYLIKVYDEVAGFVLLDDEVKNPTSTYNMGEFFILTKFQGLGVGRKAAELVFGLHPGQWEVSVIPANQRGLLFWHAVINACTAGHFKRTSVPVDFDEYCPRRIIYTFDVSR